MSYFEDASLVYIPSAVKDAKTYSIKPTDGSGDLTFSRGSDIEATRISSDGYIQKAKVNLLLQSNTFSDAAWIALGASVTSGQSGYDGTSDAWLLSKGGSNGRIYQNISFNSVGTFSVYAKAASSDWLYIRENNGNGSYFDLANGVVGTTSGLIERKIEDVGSGYYRCTVTAAFNFSNIRIYPADGDGDTSGTSGTIYIQDAQLNYGLVAQEYQETTTAAVVSGITDNMPRLNYDPANPTCPSLLLEPSRTNAVTGSEYFDGGSLINTTITASYNTADTLSPEGVYNAAKLTAGGSFPRYYDFPSTSDNTNIVISSFAKAGTASVYSLFASDKNADAAQIYFNLLNGTATLAGTSVITPVGYGIEAFPNGWYRCWLSINTGTGASSAQIRPIAHAQGQTGGWSGTNYIYAYGAQYETGSYPTSYIPTYGSFATRTADASTFDPSSLLGATQGSWFMELDDFTFEIPGTSVSSIWLGYNALNCLGLMGRTGANDKNISFVKEEINVITTLASKEISTTLKVCFVWNGTSLKCFVDGVKEYDAGSFVQPLAWSTLELNFFSRPAEQFLNKMLFFPTALSDADAIALTA